MVDISTTYAGKLNLRSPVVVASSGLSYSIRQCRAFAEAGAGAIVMKSIFEEQLDKEVAHLSREEDYPGAEEYLEHYLRSHALEEHLDKIRKCRAELPVEVPLIASVNCYRSESWIEYAEELISAGAAGLELNVMRIATDRGAEWGEEEEQLVHMVHSVREAVPSEVPITVKLGRYYSNLIRLARDLHVAGVDGLVLFNRSYLPDIDLEKEKIISGPTLSSGGEFYDTLRFASLVHGAVRELSLALSSGAEGGQELVKGILAGADVVQYCSALYRHGAEVIEESIDFLRNWLERKQYHSVDEIKGRLAATRVDHANRYMRAQFMKYFASEDATPTDIHHPTQKPRV